VTADAARRPPAGSADGTGPGADPRSESRFTPPRAECPEPWLWRSEDEGGAEDEVHELLGQAVRTLKPRTVVETGAWRGRGAVAIASALRDNGRGRVWSVELDPGAAAAAREAVASAGLGEWAEVVESSSIEWTPPGGVDLAFLDSGATVRGLEFLHLYPSMHRRTVALVHDTGRHKRQPRRQFQVLARLGLADVVWWPTPRGLAFVQPRFPATRSLRVALAGQLLGRGLPALHRAEERAVRTRDSVRARRR
jgi:predicted O-methyltransferase YrrM